MIRNIEPSFRIRDVFKKNSKMNCQLEFETAFAKKFRFKYALSFKYGRVGIYAFFVSNDISNHEVIMPSYTCPVVVESIIDSGNTPIFIDSAENSFDMSIDAISKRITSQTRGIIAINTFGYPLDLKKLNHVIEKKEKEFNSRIFLILDHAHSCDPSFSENNTHLNFDIAIYSFGINKTISSVYGGVIATNSLQHYQKLCSFKKKNIKKLSILKKLRYFTYYAFILFYFNSIIYRVLRHKLNFSLIKEGKIYYDSVGTKAPKSLFEEIPDFYYRIALIQLKRLDYIINKKKKIAQTYFKNLDDLEGLQLPINDKSATLSHFPVLVPNREHIIAQGIKKGIEFGSTYDYVLPLLMQYRKYNKNNDGFPVSDYYSKHVINLPIHSKLSKEDVKRIISFFRNQ